MQPLFELLKRYADNHTFDSGDPDCKTVLDQLFCAYQDSHDVNARPLSTVSTTAHS